MITTALLPALDEQSRPFFEFAALGELRIQACADCGVRRMPPRPRCDRCGSFSTRWDQMSGNGRVWSVVVPHPPLLPAFSDVAPYNVVVVELTDDPSIRLVGNVVSGPEDALNSVEPHSFEIGASVRVVFPAPIGGREQSSETDRERDADGGAEEDIVLPRWVIVTDD